MYVRPPPTVEHANVSVVALCCPASDVEQRLADRPPAYNCVASWKPLAHKPLAAHAPQPAYEPADVAVEAAACVRDTCENGATCVKGSVKGKESGRQCNHVRVSRRYRGAATRRAHNLNWCVRYSKLSRGRAPPSPSDSQGSH